MGLHSANSKVARLDTQMPTLKQRCEDLSDAYRIENQIKLDIHSTRITEILVSLPRALSRIDNTLLEIHRRGAEDLRRQETARRARHLRERNLIRRLPGEGTERNKAKQRSSKSSETRHEPRANQRARVKAGNHPETAELRNRQPRHGKE